VYLSAYSRCMAFPTPQKRKAALRAALKTKKGQAIQRPPTEETPMGPRGTRGEVRGSSRGKEGGVGKECKELAGGPQNVRHTRTQQRPRPAGLRNTPPPPPPVSGRLEELGVRSQSLCGVCVGWAIGGNTFFAGDCVVDVRGYVVWWPSWRVFGCIVSDTAVYGYGYWEFHFLPVIAT
jgi:hypothetical protein